MPNKVHEIRVFILESSSEDFPYLKENLAHLNNLHIEKLNTLDESLILKEKPDLLLIGCQKIKTKLELSKIRPMLLRLRKSGVWIGVFGKQNEKLELEKKIDFAHSFIELDPDSQSQTKNLLKSLIENIRFFSQSYSR